MKPSKLSMFLLPMTLSLSLNFAFAAPASWGSIQHSVVEKCDGSGFSVRIVQSSERSNYSAQVFRKDTRFLLAALPVQLVQGTGVFHFWNESRHFYLSIRKFGPTGVNGRSAKLRFDIPGSWRIEENLDCRP